MRRPRHLGIVASRERLAPWLERLGRDGPLAVDTETTGLNWSVDRVGGLCLAAGQTAIYLCKDALGPGVRWLRDQVRGERTLVFHNAKFDLHMLRGTFGLRVPHLVHDTMIESFLLDNRGAQIGTESYHGGHGLKNLAAEFVDPAALEPERDLLDAIKKAGGRGKADLLLAPPKIVGKYGALDAWYTLQLHLGFRERIRYWQQPDNTYPSLRSLYTTERWLLLALVDMEERGIRADGEFFLKWQRKLQREIDATHGRLKQLAGKEVNWSSTPQLRELLYKKLRQPVLRWTAGGKKQTPMPSTDEVALLKLKHPIGAELLRLRDLQKQHGTYATGLLNAIRTDGCIHASFKQIGAETGRLSCEDPNLQQVPRESGARRGFSARRGLVLRFADYSQIEMRFAAHLADDPTLVAGFRDDPNFDTHAATAKKMWGLRGEPTKRQRKFAKIMNFAMLYGAGEDKVTSQLVSMLTFDEALQAVKEFGHRPKAAEGPHRSLAQLLMQRYFKEFAAVKNARYRASQVAEARGYVVNPFGRHRYLEHEKWYRAFNTEIQGAAADQAKRGIVALYRELQRRDGTIALMLQIHDEAVYESDGDPRTDRRALELLKNETTFRVPIIAEMSGSAKTWQDKTEVKL